MSVEMMAESSNQFSLADSKGLNPSCRKLNTRRKKRAPKA
jgi:hypothetical protein